MQRYTKIYRKPIADMSSKNSTERVIVMKFKTEEERQKFLNDEPYYENPDSYCLGNTMEEAAEILKQICEDKPAPLQKGAGVCGNG